MHINVIGRNKALRDLEQAQKLIEEAGKILYRLPSNLSVEIQTEDDKEDDTTSD